MPSAEQRKNKNKIFHLVELIDPGEGNMEE